MMSTIWLETCRGIWKDIINKCIRLETRNQMNWECKKVVVAYREVSFRNLPEASEKNNQWQSVQTNLLSEIRNPDHSEAKGWDVRLFREAMQRIPTDVEGPNLVSPRLLICTESAGYHVTNKVKLTLSTPWGRCRWVPSFKLRPLELRGKYTRTHSIGG